MPVSCTLPAFSLCVPCPSNTAEPESAFSRYMLMRTRRPVEPRPGDGRVADPRAPASQVAGGHDRAQIGWARAAEAAAGLVALRRAQRPGDDRHKDARRLREGLGQAGPREEAALQASQDPRVQHGSAEVCVAAAGLSSRSLIFTVRVGLGLWLYIRKTFKHKVIFVL